MQRQARGAGVTLALQRTRLALALLVAAVLVTLVRVVTVTMLAGRGWWFVQEKMLLGLPMLGAAGAAAVLLVGPQLLAARQGRGDGRSAGGVVSVLTAGYAALAGPVVTFLVGYPLTLNTALITISLVCAGALLTARVVAPPAKNTADAGVVQAPEGRRARQGETWEVGFRATNPGIWMNHCHNLPHAHQGMMLRLRYDGVTTPFGGSHGGSPGHGH